MTMKGFKITINEEAPIFAGGEKITSIIICTGDDFKENIYISGMDATLNHLKWHARALKMGDRIKVQVCELDNISPYMEKKLPDYNQLRQEYKKLKKELTEEGIL